MSMQLGSSHRSYRVAVRAPERIPRLRRLGRSLAQIQRLDSNLNPTLFLLALVVDVVWHHWTACSGSMFITKGDHGRFNRYFNSYHWPCGRQDCNTLTVRDTSSFVDCSLVVAESADSTDIASTEGVGSTHGK